MSWDHGEAPQRPHRWRRAGVAAVCVLAVVLLGLIARQAAPADPISVEEATPERTIPPPEPAPTPEPPPPGEVPVSLPEDVERRQLGPLMPVATGLTLTVVTLDGQLARVELDTGDLVSARVFDREEAPLLVVPAGDGGVVVVDTPWSNGEQGGGAHYLPAPDQPAVELGSAMDGFASATRGRVWLADGDGFSGPVGLREVGTDGVVTAELTLPAGVRVHGAVDGGLLVDAAGDLVIYDPVTGEGRRFADGRVLALDSDRLARWVCDPALSCWLAVGTVDEPDVTRVELGQAEELSALTAFFSPAALSPDGRWLAFLRVGEAVPEVSVLDLESGEVRLPPAGSSASVDFFGFRAEPFAWSGSWLFTAADQGVQAWDVESGLVVPIDLDLFQIAALTVQ